jgi:3-dehydroquinate synthase
MKQELYFSNEVASTIEEVVAQINPSKIFVLVDTNTAYFVLPQLQQTSQIIANAKVITIPAGDLNKNLESLSLVWRELTLESASRSSLLINVGGGVVCDLGGFAAATYKRGIHCVNIPTTLLAAVDAAVGGKTAVNFQGLKNQIGVFREPDAVIISSIFFKTLNQHEILSGYAEMIKHALLKSEKEFARVMKFSPIDSLNNNDEYLEMLRDNVAIKADVVKKDPTEKGLRKALNLGHTAGHALEELSLERKNPIAHGYAVAWGLVIDAVLSSMLFNFSSDTLHTLANFVKENYGAYDISCKDYPHLIELMRQDKKNPDADHITFSLLKAPGKLELDAVATSEQISAALDIFCDLMGI